MKRPEKHNKTNYEDEESLYYPTIIWNEIQKPVLIVSSGAFGTHIGHLIAWFDDLGNIIGWGGDSIHV